MSTTNIHTPLFVPDVPVSESDNILDPVDIVGQFRGAVGSFECYRMIHETFMQLVHDGAFDKLPEETMRQTMNRFMVISQAIFNMERHAQDWEAGILIMKYMETTYNLDQEGNRQVVLRLKEIERKYGSLRKGLDSLFDHKDKEERKQQSTEMEND